MQTQLSEYQTKLVKWIRKTRPTIYFIIRHVSQSGMFRRISFYAIKDNKPVDLDCLIATMTHYQRDRHYEGLRVSGCGMNMGFAVIYDFSSAIFPKGFRYRKNESHRNGDPSPIDKNGGYALKHYEQL